MRRRILVLVVGAVLVVAVPLLLTAVGAPYDFALSWALLAVALMLLTRPTLVDESGAWPPPAPSSSAQGSDVSRLAWSINSRTGIAGHAVIRRVDRVLRRRLARHGLDPEDPADRLRIDELLGTGVLDLIRAREVRGADVERVLDALDRLPEQGSPPGDARTLTDPTAQERTHDR
ncbi:hypothetical protein [Microbacterium sp. GCS4]|uniref:hypothetical protein n=1 Tax=Microbacterium sp. GCS4 TaxID=1692239 RepID=UPI000A80EE0A|nr:hypothetical protein [Microbacterium sp. GCS4]